MKAKKLDKTTVTTGRIIRVENQLRPKFSNASRKYHSIWVEDADGKNQRCILLTDYQLNVAENRARYNPEDIPKKKKIVKFLEKIHRFIIRFF